MADSDRPMLPARPPWHALESLRPLALTGYRRVVVVAPHPRDEIRAAGGLLSHLTSGSSGRVEIDVLSLTRPPTLNCRGPQGLEGVGTLTVDALLDDALLDDVLGDELTDDEPDPEDVPAREAYRALGIGDPADSGAIAAVRRHRLGLPDGAVATHEADVVAAISEIVGFVADPAGLCVLAPWSSDGDPDHEAAGRAAEVVCAAYRVRLVRWLDQAWSWAGPESAEVPWRRARQLPLSETDLARKSAAAALGPAEGHDAALPAGSAPGPREVFLV